MCDLLHIAESGMTITFLSTKGYFTLHIYFTPNEQCIRFTSTYIKNLGYTASDSIKF